ncbi:MAG: hypothetical protein WC670_18355 [Pseudolabrys sp.]|jgi:hypothetical protein
MTRLPFILQDLLGSIGALCPGAPPRVVITLDRSAFDAVEVELADHFSGDLRAPLSLKYRDPDAGIQVAGVLIKPAS